MTIDVSVIILTYVNHHKYLPDLLTHYPHGVKEVILLNNSPDHPLVELDNMRVINLPTEMEVGAARNYGFKESTGECVLFLDGDDWLLPGAVNRMWQEYEKQKANKVLPIVYGDLVRSDNLAVYRPKEPYYGTELAETPLRKANRPYCCLIPRPAFEAVGGFDEDMRSWEDLDFEIQTWLGGIPSVKIDSLVYYYRFSETGRRGLMDEKCVGYDTDVVKTVGEVMYNKYNDYQTGKTEAYYGVEMARKGCSSCGSSAPPVPQRTTLQTAMQLPPPTNDEEVSIKFIAKDLPSVTIRSPYTNVAYRFNHTRATRKVVDTQSWNPVTEISRQDAQFMLQRPPVRNQHLFMVQVKYLTPTETLQVQAPTIKTNTATVVHTQQRTSPQKMGEIIAQQGQPKPKKVDPTEFDGELMTAMFEEGISKQPPIEELSVAAVQKMIRSGSVKTREVEAWYKQEKEMEKPRKTMLSMLGNFLGSASALRQR